MMVFVVTVHVIDLLRRKDKFKKICKSYVCNRRHETTLL